MKLIVVIIQDEDSLELIERLTEKEVSSTKLSSTGGFLKSGNTTLLIGTKQENVEDIISMIKESCKSRTKVIASPMATPWLSSMYMTQTIEVPVGGATIFVLDVDRFEKV